jgi:bacteriorhodopsin
MNTMLAGVGYTGFFAWATVSISFVAMLIFAIVLAVAVHKDAKNRMTESRGLFLLSPGIWSFLVLLTGGYMGALAYWLIHYSSLKSNHEKMSPVIAFPELPDGASSAPDEAK